MAANLCGAGYPTVVWNRTPSAAAPLADVGATVANTVEDAVRSAGVVITMVADGEAVAQVAEREGMLAALPPGAVWIQMATIGVAATERMAALVAERRPDVAFVDAPVSGSKNLARRGELLVLASGPPGVRATIEHVFAAVSRHTMWLGDAGRGTRLKLVLNTWLAFLMEGLAESIALADQLGITHTELRDALEGGPLAATLALSKLTRITADYYAPEFPLVWALKDIDLALDASSRPLPVMSAIGDQWHHAVVDGFGELDVSAIRLALERSEPSPSRRASTAA
jgi:3-hydroxyisobutyrate dehydrogenase